jgi:hypothetical protein
MTMRGSPLRNVIGALLTAVVTAVVARTARAAPPIGDVLAALGQPHDSVTRLKSGEILTTELQASRDTELGVALVMFVPRTPQEGMALVGSPSFFEVDKEIIAGGELDPASPETGLAAVKLGASDGKEVRQFLDAEAGKSLNLSAADVATFRALRERLGGKMASDDPGATEEVSRVLRDLLARRVRAYAERGLAGIEPYMRGDGKSSSPAEQLRAAQEHSPALGRFAPRLDAALREFPDGGSESLNQRWLWLETRAQERPTFVLAHRMWMQEPGAILGAERQYYVGHSYGACLVLAGFFEVEGGTVIAYGSRLHTDEVGGAMGGMKRNIGRGMMGKSLRRLFEDLRTALTKG